MGYMQYFIKHNNCKKKKKKTHNGVIQQLNKIISKWIVIMYKLYFSI